MDNKNTNVYSERLERGKIRKTDFIVSTLYSKVVIKKLYISGLTLFEYFLQIQNTKNQYFKMKWKTN